MAPRRPDEPEARHSGPLRERGNGVRADDVERPRGRGVVGPADHRLEQRAVRRRERPVADGGLSQVRDEQDRLEDARRLRGPVDAAAVEASALVDDGEADVPRAPVEVASRRGDAPVPRARRRRPGGVADESCREDRGRERGRFTRAEHTEASARSARLAPAPIRNPSRGRSVPGGERVPRRPGVSRNEDLRELVEVAFEARWGDQLEQACWLVPGVPERVPLAATLEDEVARPASTTRSSRSAPILPSTT